MSEKQAPTTPLEILAERFDIHAELKDFNQKQYEEYQAELVNVSREKAQTLVTLVMSKKDGEANAVLNGATVRAAVKAGFLQGVSTETPQGNAETPKPAETVFTDNLHPAACALLAKAVRQHVKEITEVPLG